MRRRGLLIRDTQQVTLLADVLDVLNRAATVNERGAVTPEMALRLSKAFNTTPQLWLNLQQFYDLWHATHDSKAWQSVRAIEASRRDRRGPVGVAAMTARRAS